MEWLGPVQITQRLAWSISLCLICCRICHSVNYLRMQYLLQFLLLLLKYVLLLKHIFLELFMIIMSRGPGLETLGKIYIFWRPSRRWLLLISGCILRRNLFASNRPVNFNVSTSCCLLSYLDLFIAVGYGFEQRYWPLALQWEKVWRQWLGSGGGPRGINLVELLELARACLGDVVQHSLQVFVVR